MDQKKCKIGVVGCGAISGIHLTAPQRNNNIEIAACADAAPAAALRYCRLDCRQEPLTETPAVLIPPA